MKILRFQATLLLSLSPFFPLVCILHAKKTALPAGQKNRMDYLFFYPALSLLYASRTLLVLTVT